MNFQEIKAKLARFLGKKSFLLAGFLVLIIIASVAFLTLRNNKVTPPLDKTWEISLAYDTNSEKLSLEKLTVVNRKTVPDLRNALYSPYKLQVLGKNGNTVYEQKINITEKILYNLLLDAPEGSLPSITNLKSVVFVPYQTNGVKINILKNNETVLEINLPESTAVKFVQSAQAATPAISCGPIITVFINDNYTNTDQFKSDVAYLKDLYNTTPPYNEAPSIFDFKEVDAPQNFGCATLGVTSCMNNLQGAIKGSALRHFPDAQKFIVLVDNPNALTVDGGIAGLVSGIGGDVVVYTNYSYANAGPLTGKPFAAAAHEFEGHAVGYLWDRYVSTDPGYANISAGDVMSNCSTNPQGEAFWKNSGSTGAFLGCGNQSQYGPFPLTCQSSRTGLSSGGTNTTIMSAIGCSANEFDQVEQAWIKDNILPNYKTCPTGAVANVNPSTTISFTPTPKTVNVGDTINLDVILNPGTNQVDFAQLVVNYDPSKLEILPAGPAICPARPADAFCPSILAFPYVMQGPIYTPGTISVTLSVGGGPTNVIQVSTKIATVTFKAIAPTIISSTEVSLNVPQSQVLSIASTDYFNQNVLTSANPALINITGIASPASTPTPTAAASPTPTPTASPSPLPSSAPTYNCVFDPATCDSGQSSIQLCYLKCTPI